jgi:hypothetical protein
MIIKGRSSSVRKLSSFVTTIITIMTDIIITLLIIIIIMIILLLTWLALLMVLRSSSWMGMRTREHDMHTRCGSHGSVSISISVVWLARGYTSASRGTSIFWLLQSWGRGRVGHDVSASPRSATTAT